MLRRFIAPLLVLVFTVSCSLLDIGFFNTYKPLATLGTGYFQDTAWSPDGEVLAIASTRGVWLDSVSDLSGDGELLVIDGGASMVKYSPSGDYLASISADGRIWDMQTKQPILTVYETDAVWVQNISFSPDERFVVVSVGSQSISLWDLSSGQMIFEQDGYRPRFTPDSKTLLFTNYVDNVEVLHVWNIERSQETLSIPLDDFTYLIRVSPDGDTLITVFDNPNTSQSGMRFWSLLTGEEISTIRGYDYSGRLAKVVFSPTDSNLFAFVDHAVPYVPGFSASIVLWDMQTNSVVHRLSEYTSSITDIEFSPDGRFLATSEKSNFETKESYIRLWNVEDGRQIAISPAFVRDDIQEIHFNPDGTKLASIHSDGIVRIWSASNLEHLQDIGQGRVVAQFASDGTSVATANNNGRLQLWSIDTEMYAYSEKTSIQTDFLPLNQVAGSSSLSVVAFTTGDRYDSEVDGYMHTLQLWHSATGEVTILHQHEVEQIGTIAINHQGTLLAAVMSDGITLWDIQTGERLEQILTEARAIVTLSFSPDDKFLASGGCGGTDVEGVCNLGEIHVWDIETGEHLFEPIHEHTSAVYALQFSPNGSELISGSGGQIFYGSLDDYSISRWSMATGEQLGTPATGHQGQITTLVFDETGEYIISGSGDSVFSHDSSIRLWDSALHQTLAVFADNAPAVEDLVISGSGSLLISIHIDGMLRFWNIPFENPVSV